MIWYTLKIALTSIIANKGRSLLTMLGVIIGIGSVVLIMAVGEGAQSLILGEIQSLGSNLVGVLPGNTGKDGPPASVMGITVTTLSYADAQAISDRRNVPHIIGVAPFSKGFGPVVFRGDSVDTTYSGTSSDYPFVQDHEVMTGRFFNQSEEQSAAKVAVLGYQVWEDLFNREDAIGEKVKVGKESFRVIGVMASKGAGGLIDFNDQIYVPVTALQKLVLGVNHLGLIRAKVEGPEYIDQTIIDIKNLLRRRHRIDQPKDDDFTVASQNQALSIIESVTTGLQFFLAAVAAISLIVGGIGIMNIMLIAVSERTREIGLRKAIGARPASILSQFLIESVVITVIGAIIGIIGGGSLAFLVALLMKHLAYNWVFRISLFSLFISVFVAFLVGLLFGLYPARKAAGLKPIDALRYE